MLHRNAQACARRLIVSQLASYDKGIQPNLQQPLVVPHRLQALHFYVVRLHVVAPGGSREGGIVSARVKAQAPISAYWVNKQRLGQAASHGEA